MCAEAIKRPPRLLLYESPEECKEYTVSFQGEGGKAQLVFKKIYGEYEIRLNGTQIAAGKDHSTKHRDRDWSSCVLDVSLVKGENRLTVVCKSSTRLWQGIPSIECTEKGRLFSAFYSGGTTEQLGNYCVLLKSDDGGDTWSEPIAAADAGGSYRCYDPCLWIDPLGRLWFIWAVMPRNIPSMVRRVALRSGIRR